MRPIPHDSTINMNGIPAVFSLFEFMDPIFTREVVFARVGVLVEAGPAGRPPAMRYGLKV
jgi:hypothetical protein